MWLKVVCGYLTRWSRRSSRCSAVIVRIASNLASDRLTALERETLTLFASGRSYTEIAEARGNSTVTVRNTLYRIQGKLGVKNKQELVIWAVRNGLLDDVAVGRDSQALPEG